MNRPAKLPYPASGRVVKACLMLSDALKLEWQEHVVLDGTEGAFIGAGPLAQRLGKSRDAVERGRRELLRLGLLKAGERGRGQTGTYYPTLPEDCIPSRRPSPAEVARLAERLDDHIRRVRAGIPVDEVAASVAQSGGIPDPGVAAERGRSGGIGAVEVAASVTPEWRHERRQSPAENRAESGGTDDTTKSLQRVEGGWREGGGTTQPSPQPSHPEGGETQPSEGGVSAHAEVKAEELRASQDGERGDYAARRALWEPYRPKDRGEA